MKSSRILVIDDEPGIIRLCERLLSKEGYAVSVFADVDLAIKMLEQQPFDLLLVDVRMPAMGGFDFIEKARQLQPDTAILVMTGFGSVETAIQALRQGVDGLILKPFRSGAELVQAVQQALTDNRRKRDALLVQALQPMFDLSEAFLAETDPGRLLRLVLAAISGHLRCTCCGFYNYDPDKDLLVVQESVGNPLPEKAIQKGGLLTNARRDGTPVWVKSRSAGDWLAASGFSAVMAAPVNRQKVQGTFYTARLVSEQPFREVDWEQFLLLTRQAAVALENAALYEEMRLYIKQIEASQQALIRAEKMAAAGRMTASIAHEINNPLQAMQNCLHLAASPGAPEEKRIEYIHTTGKELDRLMQSVQRMLELFRPSKLEPRLVDVGELIKDVINFLRSQLEGRGISVSTGISSRLPKTVVIPGQIRQVLINLILNAYDAMPDGGELRITARLARDNIEINLQDTGQGIPPGDRGKIFEPFFSTREGGTGLGLSISSGIISAHGGSLDYVAERSPGACFRILLPAGEDRK